MARVTTSKTRKLPFPLENGEVLCHVVRRTVTTQRGDVHHCNYIVLVYRRMASRPHKEQRIDVQLCGNYLVAVDGFLKQFSEDVFDALNAVRTFV